MPTDTKQNEAPALPADSKTAHNLGVALGAEEKTYLRYKWFERKAERDGFRALSDLFSKTAENEMEHAEIWFRYLGGAGGTERNLETAAEGEHFEWESLYAQFAAEAREEGFPVIADLFEKVAAIEKAHEENFRRALTELQSGAAFAGGPDTKWICLNCGHVVTGEKPPALCPVCAHPQGSFTRKTN